MSIEKTANAKYFLLALKHALEAGKMSQKNFGLLTGLNPGLISQWQSGDRNPGAASQAKAAAALGYTLSAFLALGQTLAEGETPPPPPAPAWMVPLLPDLAKLDEAGRAAVKALVKGLGKKGK
jgi:transcriptional regulator with XRE-family HTH domain